MPKRGTLLSEIDQCGECIRQAQVIRTLLGPLDEVIIVFELLWRGKDYTKTVVGQVQIERVSEETRLIQQYQLMIVFR